MERDSRFYDIVTSFATDNPADGIKLFKNMLGERVEGMVADMTKSFSYTGPSNEPTND